MIYLCLIKQRCNMIDSTKIVESIVSDITELKLTGKEKYRMALDLDISLPTINRYLAGKVRYIDTAISILNYSKKNLKSK